MNHSLRKIDCFSSFFSEKVQKEVMLHCTYCCYYISYSCNYYCSQCKKVKPPFVIQGILVLSLVHVVLVTSVSVQQSHLFIKPLFLLH